MSTGYNIINVRVLTYALKGGRDETTCNIEAEQKLN